MRKTDQINSRAALSWLLAALLCLSLPGCANAPAHGAEEGSVVPALSPAQEASEPPLPSDDPVITDGNSPAAPQTDPRQETLQAILEQMSLEEKVGQLFLAICPADSRLEAVQEYHLGGCVLFGQDFKDGEGRWLTREAFVEKLDGWQAAVNIPLLIASDEEGGTVTRASRNPNLFSEKIQSPRQLYAQGGLAAIREDTQIKSASLLDLGINVNLAPVADVSTQPEDFMYQRSLGQDPETTASYVAAVVEEMNAAGIGATLKHFPGYGDNGDTHTGAVTDDRPYETFLTQDFLPFRAGIKAGAGSVLVSHNVVNCMDDALPASLSPEVHRILREELSFEGVIMTDDLSMGAMDAYTREKSAAVLALLAGNDMLLTRNFASQIPQVLEAIREGQLEEERIDQAVLRVLGWKYDLGLLGNR